MLLSHLSVLELIETLWNVKEESMIPLKDRIKN